MLADGLTVVVHCHGGAWPLYSDYQATFIEVLRQLGQEWGQ
jgi:hypothetical protein